MDPSRSATRKSKYPAIPSHTPMEKVVPILLKSKETGVSSFPMKKVEPPKSVTSELRDPEIPSISMQKAASSKSVLHMSDDPPIPSVPMKKVVADERVIPMSDYPAIPYIPMKKTVPYKSSIPRWAELPSYDKDTRKRAIPNRDPANDPITSFLRLQLIKNDRELNPSAPLRCSDASPNFAVKWRSNTIVGTSIISAANSGPTGSSRTEDLRQSLCEICAEKKQRYEMIRINKTCSHSFCSICVSKHVKTRIADNQVTVPCLGLNCKHAVEFQSCVGILPQDVLDAWDGKLCESLILDAHKFYCPFRDCSATLVNDSEKLIKECECPHCNRLFCAQCRVPWHTGMSCEELQELNEDERGKEDLLLRNLAKEKKWRRCPKCKFYVERTEGCPHMICRCRYEFCYGCGTQWGYAHAGCSRS